MHDSEHADGEMSDQMIHLTLNHVRLHRPEMTVSFPSTASVTMVRDGGSLSWMSSDRTWSVLRQQKASPAHRLPSTEKSPESRHSSPPFNTNIGHGRET